MSRPVANAVPAPGRLLASPPAIERFFQFSLLALLASGYLAVAGSGYLDGPTMAATALGLLLRGLSVAGLIRIELSNRTLAGLAVAYVLFWPIDYLFLSRGFIPSVVHLIFFLAIVQVLSARTDRNYFFVKLLAFVEMLAASVLSGNSNYFVFLGLFLVSGVATFAASEVRRASLRAGKVAQVNASRLPLRLAFLTGGTAAAILLLTAGLFFILPRTARAAFRHLVPEQYHLAGFSTEVELGKMGELRATATPVMHVRIEGIGYGLHLKWRGAALSRFDGRRWYNPPARGEELRPVDGQLIVAGDAQRQRRGGRFSYEVAMQGLDTDTLFLAGVPEILRVAAPIVFRGNGDTYRMGSGYGESRRYYAYSYLPDEAVGTLYAVPALADPARAEYLQLPDSMDGRIAQLASRVAGPTGTDYEKARRLETHLRTRYGYTTDLGSERAADPLARFLFERRAGHCEYFASAMAVMLRQSGIPARVVTGFQSGTFNPLTGWHVVRTSDAHSWVEAWLEGRGWYTLDPTPPDPRPAGTGLWTRMLMLADAADTFWREWVLDYDRERQFNLALKLEPAARSRTIDFEAVQRQAHEFWAAARTKTARFAIPVGGGILLLGLVLLATVMLRRVLATRAQTERLRRGEVQPHDATVLYARMLAALRRRGLEKPAWMTAAEFCEVAAQSDRHLDVREFTAAYHALRYGGDAAAAGRMLTLLDAAERTPAS